MKETKFKQTEIGDIPVDWEVKTIREAFRTLPNNTLSRDCLNYSKGDYYNIHYGDVLIKFPEYTDCKIEGIPHINDGCSFNKTVLHDGDIVMADTAEDETAGKVTEIFNSQEMKIVSGLHTIPMRPLIEFAPKWLGFSMNCSLYHNQLLPLQCGTKVTSVSKSAIADTMIAYPSTVEEQERIAEALSDVDVLLRELDAEIAKKRAIKQGAMQELLTGKRRLEGFGGEWEEKKLGKIGFTFNGLTGKTIADFGNGEARYITFLNVLNNPIINTKIFEKVNVRPTEKQNAVRKFDLFFNTSSETPEEVGTCSVLLDEVSNVYLNSFCFGYRLIDENVNGLYLAYYFRCKLGRELMTALAQGSTRYNLSKDQFLKSSILLPNTLDEQTAIAKILSDMDADIEALEAKRAKYAALKQGMMQELLTGRGRDC